MVLPGAASAIAANASQTKDAGWRVQAQIGGPIFGGPWVDGDRLYVEQGRRLVASDRSDPARPREIWRSVETLPGDVVALRDGIVYLRGNGFVAAHRASPELTLLSRSSLGGRYGVGAVSEDGWLALASTVPAVGELRRTFIELVDARDPENLRVANRWAPEGAPGGQTINELVHDGRWLFASSCDLRCEHGTLMKLERDDAGGLHERARWRLEGRIAPLAAADGLLVAERSGFGIARSLTIYDLRDPDALRRVAVLPVPRSVQGAALRDGRLTYLVGCVEWDVCVDDPAQLRVVDVVAPAEPVELGRLALPVAAAWSLSMAGDLGYISAQGVRHVVVDLRTPEAMRVRHVEAAPLEGVYSMMAARSSLLVYDWRHDDIVESGLRTLRPEPDGGVVLLGRMRVPPPLAVEGDLAFTEARLEDPEEDEETTRLLRLDVGRPEAPRVIDTPIRFDERVSDMSLEGGLLFVARRTQLQVIDVSTPGAERLLARIDDGTRFASAVLLRDGIGYALRAAASQDEQERIEVYDLSRPTAPRRIGALDLPAQEVFTGLAARLLPLAGERLLVQGQVMLDVSDPEQPRPLGLLDRARGEPLRVGAAAARESRLYVSAHPCLYALDVGGTGPPRTLAAHEHEATADDLALHGPSLYAASLYHGIEALPAEPPAGAALPERCGAIGWRAAVGGALPRGRVWMPYAEG